MTAPPVLRSLAGGEWLDGRPTPDVNPARPDEVVAEVRLVDAPGAAQAVQAARHALAGWRTTPPPARGEVLRRAADRLEARAAEIGHELAREEGKTLAEAVGETRRAVAILRYFAGQTLEPDGETYPSASPLTLLYARREPVGVVLAITPWNFPIAIPAWKIAPALAYGNTVVWKPAELTPLTSVRLVEALREAGLPDGALNLVLGRGSEVGDALTDHRDVDAITFTGSNPVGRAIQRRAVERGARVQLEMGGKNPAVVLADADLDLATEQVARGAFLSAGQKCTATSRVIVDRAVLEPLAERLAGVARAWRLGDPLDPETQVGPVVSRPALESILAYLERGRADGGSYLAGGGRAERLGDGFYVEPSVIADLPPSSPLVREEIFGPVVAMLPADGFDDALAQANDTVFGLSASLFTRDLGAALRFAQEARAGVVKINQESAGLELQVPFGGMKESSSGSREQGKVARDFFTQWRTVYLDRPS
jgi:alpha-ketoglutaric semialdehyde dehydrogenase